MGLEARDYAADGWSQLDAIGLALIVVLIVLAIVVDRLWSRWRR